MTVEQETRTNSHFMCSCGHYHYPSPDHPGTVVRMTEQASQYGSGPKAVVGQEYVVSHGGKRATYLVNPDGGEEIVIHAYSGSGLEIVTPVEHPGYPAWYEGRGPEGPVPTTRTSLEDVEQEWVDAWEGWASDFADEELRTGAPLQVALARLVSRLNQSVVGQQLAGRVEREWIERILA